MGASRYLFECLIPNVGAMVSDAGSISGGGDLSLAEKLDKIRSPKLQNQREVDIKRRCPQLPSPLTIDRLLLCS